MSNWWVLDIKIHHSWYIGFEASKGNLKCDIEYSDLKGVRGEQIYSNAVVVLMKLDEVIYIEHNDMRI